LISSTRVKLSAMTEADVSKEYLETLNDIEYMKYSRNATFIHTIESQNQYITDFKLSNHLLFSIKDAGNERMLGSINCYIDFSRMELDLGFLIFKNHRGKGYASEALGLLIPYLQSQFPGMTAVIGSNKDNLAMHEVAKKLGFQLEDSSSINSKQNVRFLRRFPRLDFESVPSVPDFVLNAKRIGVVANDAGGAEQISWLMRYLQQKVLAYVDGPAKQIFRNAQLPFDEVDHLSEIMKCDLIITGSGWMSTLEVDAIRESKLSGIPCLTVLDHWVNYLERFGEDDNGKPQILAVTNSVALRMAHEKFPELTVWLLPDFQISHYREALAKVETSPACVLIVLEPILKSDSEFSANHEIYKSIFKSAALLKDAKGLRSVLVRRHPSQIDNPVLLDELRGLVGEFEISEKPTLLEDLERSEAVLGLNSYALYISAMCGFETYSFFAGAQGHWTNNFPEIMQPEP